MDNQDLRLFSKSQTAKLLGIGKEKLGKLLVSGRLGFIQIDDRIYIPYSEILNFIKENTVKLTEESAKQIIRRPFSKMNSETSTNAQFDSISLFNKLLERNTNGKYI
ncbi:MAG: helix-turn-helix domain-containing protein [Ignavibacteriaceae bacterium]